jgi:hypothetical protein
MKRVITAKEPSPYPSPRGRGNKRGLLKDIDGETPGRIFEGIQEVEE